jgi:DNA uptake protein ComE-like DNA-binding protein
MNRLPVAEQWRYRHNSAVHKEATIVVFAATLMCMPCWCAPLPPPAQGARTQHAPPSPEARVDINHASLEQLMKVPGLARPWAERIVRFRPYHSKQDLVDNGILPGEVYDRIKDYVIAHREKK